MKRTSFGNFAWTVLAYNILVVLWGAFVRATGSGAGCGSHWPSCNGEIIPRAPQIETVIEFIHRVTSGLSLVLVLVLFVWAFRAYPKNHSVRRGASFSLLFIITEALVGAGLVLFEWVAMDASVGRVVSIAIHLINTFLLLACLAVTAWWGSGGEALNLKGHGIAFWLFVFAFVGVILIGVTGAITALGDTLFPSANLAEGIRQDLNPATHFVVRLRVWHPIIAVLVGAFLLFLTGLVAMFRVTPVIRFFALALAVLVVVQGIAGIINLVLLAPVWMQLVHLLLADLVWLALVLFFATNFAESEISQNV